MPDYIVMATYPDYLRKDKLRLLGRWVQPPLSGEFWMYWARTEPYKALGIEDVDGAIAILDHNYFVQTKDLDIIEGAAQRAVQEEDKDFFKNFSKVSDKPIEDLLNIGPKALKDYEVSDLQKSFSTFAHSFRDNITPWLIAIFFGYGVEREISSLAKKEGIGLEILAPYARSPKPTLLLQYNTKTAEIANELKEAKLFEVIKNSNPTDSLSKIEKEDNTLHDKIQQHLKEFEWVGTHHFWGDPLDARKLFEHILAITPEKESELSEIPDNLKYMLEVAGELGFYRQYCAEASDVSAYEVKRMLGAVGKELGVGEDYIYFGDFEIMQALEGTIALPKNEVEERKRNHAIIVIDGKDKILIGKQADELLESFMPKIDTNISEFKGTVASVGNTIGKVRIITLPEDVAQMQHGEILVTNQTTPDFVPAMRKAAAVVTDEGGLTCHAAIISRELGVPCVVGTKVATRVLKDGDMVEVDATKGIVKRINF